MILYKNYSVFLKKITKLKFQSHYRFITGLNLWNEEISPEIKHKIQSHWRDKIANESFKENDENREKYYVLSMFPYPSGSLHLGHVRVYTISDAIARFQRMNGKNVIHPIGWDAFGLPAENAAIERGIQPAKWTRDNIDRMRGQFQELGCSFDWERQVSTCQPEYYRWTQELFLKLYDAGLVYQKQALVNWDPVDKTVLADEQVDEKGHSWRSGVKVEKKLLKQWFIRTTRFAKDLLEGLNDDVLHDWRDIIKLQRHWIGECNGVNFDFRIVGRKHDFLTLWTSTPEYVEHVEFVAVSGRHFLAQEQGESLGTRKLEIELENPFNQQKIPVFVTDELEFLPFTDSYLGIPAVCEQASSFAHKFLLNYAKSPEIAAKASEEICLKARELRIGGFWTSAKLRDWLISRQRYWGTPIPMIHCDNCGPQPVPRQDLPVKLPDLNPESGVSRLGNLKNWVNTPCPNCKMPARRETDTMDTFVDSSWYYLRYLDPTNDSVMFEVEKARKMTPVDLYIGGKEHAVLHLYYARFISHFLHSLGMLPEREPFKRLLVQGMVMGRSYRIKGTGQYLPVDEVNVLDLKRNKAVHKTSNQPVVISWEKMSKSKHNGVDPNDMFKEYSVDTIRLLMLADVAPTSHRNWNSNTFPGIINWQKRLWLTIRDFLAHRNNLPAQISQDKFSAHEDYLFDCRNYYIKGTTFNYCISQQHSVAISKQQGLTNSLRKSPPAIIAHSLQFERALASQILLLAPMAPCFASELWSGFLSAPHRLNMTGEIDWNRSVLDQKWPEIDLDYNLDLVCQVNGTETCVVKIPRRELEKLSREEAIEIALKQKSVQEKLESTVLKTLCTVYEKYETVVNFKTKKRAQTEEKEQKEDCL